MSQLSPTTKQRIGDHAVRRDAALSDALDAMGKTRPQTVEVGDWRLSALSFDDERKRSAERAVNGFSDSDAPRPRRGQGDVLWCTKVNVIKFGFLVDLASAWRATGETKYAEAARDYVNDFIEYHGNEPFGSSPVRMAGRVRHWLAALPHLLDSDAFDEPFVRRMIDNVCIQINGLAAVDKNPGNVRLMIADTFVQSRLLLRFIPESEDWIQQARDIYTDAARRDLEPDGSHIEHDPHYHKCYQGTFEKLLLWSRAFPDEGLPAFPELAARIFDYACAALRPNGEEAGMEDGVGAWVADGSPASLLERRAGIRRLAGLDETPPPLGRCFPDAGQVFMRTGWGVNDQYATFDASRWGGAHTHLSRNAIQLHAFGRTLVTDPGFFSYWMQHSAANGDELDNRIAPYAKSTPAHNTLNLNGWNQAPTNPDYLKAHLSPACHAVVSRYSGGYWPGWYGWWFGDGFGAGVHAEHTRILVWLPGRVAVVIDTMMRWDETALGEPAQQAPSLEMNWQLSPGAVDFDARKRRLVTRNADANVMLLMPKLAPNMTLSVKEGQMDPFRGWVGSSREAKPPLDRVGAFDTPTLNQWRDRGYVPAPQLCAVAEPMDGFGATMVSVLVPFEGTETPPLQVDLAGAANTDEIGRSTTPGTISLTWGNGTCDTIVYTPSLRASIGAHEDLKTDGSVLHLRRDGNGTVKEGVALDATYCEPFAPRRRDSAGAIAIAPD